MQFSTAHRQVPIWTAIKLAAGALLGWSFLSYVLFLVLDNYQPEHLTHVGITQWKSLPDRYVICSSPARAPLNIQPSSARGYIYTGDEVMFAETQGFVDCVAVANGSIAQVGHENDVLLHFCEIDHDASLPSNHLALAGKKKRRGPRGHKAARLERAKALAQSRINQVAFDASCDIRRLAPGQTLLPGFQDAHGHILDYGWSRSVANLVGTTSVDDVIERLESYVRSDPKLMAFVADNNIEKNVKDKPWIEGLGWDQTKWSPPIFPTAADLSRSVLLRKFPIMLRRIDVHALWLSEVGLELVATNAKRFAQPSRSSNWRVDRQCHESGVSGNAEKDDRPAQALSRSRDPRFASRRNYCSW
jgi:hypothetical protein